MKKIYIFGNALLPFDNLPLRLLPKLQKKFPAWEFIASDPNENLTPENGELFIIDTVMDIPRATIITDLEKLADSPNYSAHDLDLGFNLKLLKKIGRLKQAMILGIPPELNETEALEQLSRLINSL